MLELGVLMTAVTARDAFGLCMAVVLLSRPPRALVGVSYEYN